jgi:hypothetical protein
MKFKDELDQLFQDDFCKLKIRAGEAHQLLANFQMILKKDSWSSLWNQTAKIL